MKDEGDDSAEALNRSQESMEKSMKKKREEGRARMKRENVRGNIIIWNGKSGGNI